MAKYIYTACLFLLFGFSRGIAQLPYTVTTQQQPYTPLTGASSLNNGAVWNYQVFTAPLGFNFRMDSIIFSRFVFYKGTMVLSDTTGVVSEFVLNDAELFDKGFPGDTVSLSPISYRVTGNPGSRIFQVEIGNAAFRDEWSFYQTQQDSVNMQVWMYEGSNIVELRYGPSHITYPAVYFPSNGQPKIGFVRHFNYNNANFQAFYLLSGNPTGPTVDSIVGSHNGTGLSSFPASGTVYRFTPTDTSAMPAGIKNTFSSAEVKVYPVQCSDEVTVEYNSRQAGAYSIISITGSRISSGTLVSGQNKINVSGLATGVFIIQISNALGSQAYKLVKR